MKTKIPSKKTLCRVAALLVLLALVMAIPASAKYVGDGDLVWSTKLDGLTYEALTELIEDGGTGTPGTGEECTCECACELCVFLKAHPEGSIYMSMSPDNPALKYGGEWDAWGKGRVPLGVGKDNDAGYLTSDYPSAGLRGGSEGDSTPAAKTVSLNGGTISGTIPIFGGVTVNNDGAVNLSTVGKVTLGTNGSVSLNTNGSVDLSNTPSITGTALTSTQVPQHTHTQSSHTHTTPDHTHSTPNHTHPDSSHSHTSILWMCHNKDGTGNGTKSYADVGSSNNKVSWTTAGGAATSSATYGVSVQSATTSTPSGGGSTTGTAAPTTNATTPPALGTWGGNASGGTDTHTHSATWPTYSLTAPTYSLTAPTYSFTDPTYTLTSPSATHNITASSANLTLGGTGTVNVTDNTMQPYITCYMWLRKPGGTLKCEGTPCTCGAGGSAGTAGPEGPVGPQGPEGPEGPEGPAGSVAGIEAGSAAYLTLNSVSKELGVNVKDISSHTSGVALSSSSQNLITERGVYNALRGGKVSVAKSWVTTNMNTTIHTNLQAMRTTAIGKGLPVAFNTKYPCNIDIVAAQTAIHLSMIEYYSYNGTTSTMVDGYGTMVMNSSTVRYFHMVVDNDSDYTLLYFNPTDTVTGKYEVAITGPAALNGWIDFIAPLDLIA